eukprot:TRINITY_DN2499_c0_g1_i2.p1 TRINITY_DN2499_c0_g1~~TRINITY_DN2499_c0_g1_i2.p1  ORF type:complete len:358 (+),score=189.16 TRINITY_DN2499_c0_g1_i2:59-1132(+)
MPEKDDALVEDNGSVVDVDEDVQENDDEATATTRLSDAPTSVIVHPLVLLSVVDHYERVARSTQKRVVGVLLGEVSRGVVDVSNSYAVPFEEDAKDGSIWFLDHNYHEQMHRMFKKVNARENVVGWYSTGPKVRTSDLEINELLRKYTPNPVLLVVEPRGEETLGLPTQAYVSVEEVSESRDGVARSQRTFRHIASTMGALEAEEVGVEHLLRDIRRLSTATLGQSVEARRDALCSLQGQLATLRRYVSDVQAGRLPLSQRVVAHAQHAFNLAPAVNEPALAAAFANNTNDALLTVYTASMARSVIALHNLLLNKRQTLEDERRDASKDDADADALLAAATSAAAGGDSKGSAEKKK